VTELAELCPQEL